MNYYNNIKIRQNTLPFQQLLNFYKKNDLEFDPALSTQVDVDIYISKIYQNALRFEAFYNNKFVGIIAVYFNQKEGYITSVLVDKSYQHMGIGKKLLEQVVKFADNNNFPLIGLEVYSKNKKAISFYEKFNFIKEKETDTKISMKRRAYSTPKVSICCITYNHEKYIRQCLDGFIMQQTDFPFEVIIHDDASTDKTPEIIKEYELKYPDIIKPIYQKTNLFSIDSKKIFLATNQKLQGEYATMCEGDDYWTDPLKLQKQADFLDNNPDYSICFHTALKYFETKINEDYLTPLNDYTNYEFNFKTLLKDNFIATSSVMYRWRFHKDEFNKLYPVNIIPGDWYLNLLHAQVGKIGFLKDVMSVYRINPGGIWYINYYKHNNIYLNNGFKLINCYKNVYKNISDFSQDFFENQLYIIYLKIFIAYLTNLKLLKIIKLIMLNPIISIKCLLLFLKHLSLSSLNKLINSFKSIIKKIKKILFIVKFS